ncbi:MAG: hypothetical protein M5U29_07555 [Anaerolineae bacterium]|nr:hypothetical protein [Anaerolineae bacterium]
MTIYKKSWGAAREVPVHAIPSRNHQSRWASLYHDVMLRMERTGDKQALEYPFDTVEEAKMAQRALLQYFRRNGQAGLRTAFRCGPDTQARLYVWREKPNGRMK